MEAGPSSQPYSASQVPFRPAAQAEIIRASQKDSYYVATFKELVENAFRSLLGPRLLQKHAAQVELSTKMLYFSLTTFLGSQTLGEEYTDILQISKAGRRVPTRQRRLFLLALHVVAPYLVMGLYNQFKQKLKDWREVIHDLPKWKAKLAKLDLPPFTNLLEEQIRPWNLALFFLIGKYYSIAKRTLRIGYLSTQPIFPNMPPPPSYEVLGVLLAIQLCTRAISSAYKKRAKRLEAEQRAKAEEKAQRLEPSVDGVALSDKLFDPENPSDPQQAEDEDEEEPVKQEHRCTLCLGVKRDPTATECGHVFCWECIVGWARERSECPLCRQPVKTLSDLLPLYNF